MAGILHTDAEVLVWADRLVNGPYKTQGDRSGFTNSPGAGDEIITKANKLLNDEVDDFWNGTITTPSGLDSYTYNKGHYVLASAFYYLLTGAIAYGDKAKSAILQQVRSANPNFSTLTIPLSGNIFHFAGFSTRIMLAYDYCKDLFTTGETAEVIAWLDTQYLKWKFDSEYWPKSAFPNRNNRDYSVLTGYAANPTTYQYANAATPEESAFPGKSWTHYNADGSAGNRIYWLHRLWYNAMAYESLWLTVYGALKNDDTIIDHSLIWYEEVLKYATFPDGTSGECFRNFDYSRPQTATAYYENVITEAMILSAEIAARRDNFSLYNLSTSTGMQGSEGGPKSLRLRLTEKIRVCTGTPKTYYEDNIDDEAHILDAQFVTYRYRPETLMAWPNKFYQEDLLKDTYMNVNAEYQYATTWGGPYYNVDSKWAGNLGVLPALPLMSYEMESVSVYPDARKVNKKMLMA